MSRPSRRDRSARAAERAAAADAVSWSGPPTEAGPRLDRLRSMFASGEPILADGAMGTMLFAAGLSSGDPPEVWNLAHPDVVRGVHRGYLDAGSRILLTNTFGANVSGWPCIGLDDRVEQLNRTAAILLRAEVTAAGVEALVAGDIGPSGEIMAPSGRSNARPRSTCSRSRRRPRGGWRGPVLDRDDVRPVRDGGSDRRRAARLARRPRSWRR